MDFKLTDEQIALRKEFFDVCEELEKRKPQGFAGFESTYDTDEGWEYHRYCAKEFAKRGWLSLGWSREYGGKGAIMDRVFFSEAVGYYDVPGVDTFGIGMLAPTLLAAASDEIKGEFLPKIASADIMWCQLWSEPNAGSDLASLTTTARREGDEYVINGQKIWSTGAHRADWAFALVRTDPNAESKHRGLTFILFDMKTPGITVRPILFLDGGHMYNEVFLDDVRVPVKYVVGEENKGWAITQVTASFERSNLGSIMGMERQLQELVKYCNETKVDGEPLAKKPLVRNRLADIACQIEAARALAYRIADAQIKNEMALFDASAVKVYAGDLLRRIAVAAADIVGPYAQVKRSEWAPMGGMVERQYQQYFILTVSMGTNEIQRNIIAWYGLGLPRMR
jgi:alkylation response protein AidB-like acyl-CoA dehydrogenase